MTIDEWREAHPSERVTVEVLKSIYGANLYGANLYGANLYGADLRGADLRGAGLYDVDLRNADLRYADLRNANLSYADLRNANLRYADLRNVDLRNADLRYVDRWGALPIQAGRSGSGYLIPTPDGWRISIGCWQTKTLDDLRDLIADRVEWPEAKGEERDRRRPMLTAVLAVCEAHIEQQPADIIVKLAEKWGTSEGTERMSTGPEFAQALDSYRKHLIDLGYRTEEVTLMLIGFQAGLEAPR